MIFKKLILGFLINHLNFSFAADFIVTVDEKKTVIDEKSIAANLKLQTVEINIPNESQPGKPSRGKFKAYEGKKFLDFVFGKNFNWQKSKTLTFACSDGFKPEFSTKDFLKDDFLFAIERFDNKKFEMINHAKDHKPVYLGPYYLIWTSESKFLAENIRFWPYQLVEIQAGK